MSASQAIEKEINVLIDQAYDIRGYELVRSVALTEKALALSKVHKLPSLIAKSLSKLALYAMIRGEQKESIDYSLEAIQIFKELDDELGIADANYSIASVYYKTNNYHLGMVYLFDCLITFRKFGDHHNESRTLKSIGAIYEFLGDYPNAKTSYQGAIKSARKIQNKNLESNAYNPLSGLLLKLNNTTEALSLIEKSIEMKGETGDLRGLGFAIYGRGKVYMHLGRYTEAETDLLEAYKTHERYGEHLGMCMASHKIAVLWKKMGKIQAAKSRCEETIVFCETHDILIIHIKSQHFMYQVCKDEGAIEKALYYLERYNELNDSITNAETLKVIENYETAAKIKSSEREARLELEKAEISADKEKAEQAALVKQEFLSAMSHEIRTPLNAVTSIISLLAERTSEKEKKLLTSLRFSSKNLLRIIDDILDFSKLESNKMVLEKRPVSFHELLNNIRETYAIMALEKGLDLELIVAKEISESYAIDETKLFQILGNLLSNAIKYSNEGRVTLKVDVQKSNISKDTILFEVSDTGVGIAPKEKQRIFESFYIPFSVTTRNLGGTGLGLAIVRKLVELHDSTIYAESEIDKGSRFYFSLELDKTDPPLTLGAELYQQLDGKKAILAEDNEINAMVMTQLLEKYGITIKRAKNGEDAVALAKNCPVDFILMDIHMPIMNGYEATEIIRAQASCNHNTPIFALTADITALNKEGCAPMFNDFLRKPMQIKQLLNALYKVANTETNVL